MRKRTKPTNTAIRAPFVTSSSLPFDSSMIGEVRDGAGVPKTAVVGAGDIPKMEDESR